MKGFNLTINDTKYFVRCDWSFQQNKNMQGESYFGIHLVLIVKNTKTGNYLTGKEVKGTYLAEKISDYIENAVNGQRAVYWDFNSKNENGEVII